jgi:hypothetical protein
MPLESVTYISDFIASNPVGATDPKSQGDDHLRNIKAGILNTWPNVDGPVTSTPTEFNRLTGLTGLTGSGNLVASASPTFTGTVTLAAASASGTITANLFSGSGASLTALNATNLASGTVPDARFPATLPAVSGANLTNLNASNASSGTLSDSRLSSNVPLKNAANTFTGGTQAATSAAGSVGWSCSYNATVNGQLIASSSGTVFIGAASSHPVDLVTDNTTRLSIAANGNFDFKGGAVTTNNASAAEVGYKGLPENQQTGNYTLVLSDACKMLSNNTGGATFTIPANASVAYPIGTFLLFVADAGAMTIAITTDSMFLAGTAFGTSGSRTLAVGGLACAVKFNATQWIISGSGLS